MRGAQWDTYLSVAKANHPQPPPRRWGFKIAATRDGLKNLCSQILGPDQAGLGYRKSREPFVNHSFLMALAATFGGHINLATNQIVHMLLLTFEALAFTALAVSCLLRSDWVTPLNVKLLSLF
jgi:hypothetical protein